MATHRDEQRNSPIAVAYCKAPEAGDAALDLFLGQHAPLECLESKAGTDSDIAPLTRPAGSGLPQRIPNQHKRRRPPSRDVQTQATARNEDCNQKAEINACAGHQMAEQQDIWATGSERADAQGCKATDLSEIKTEQKEQSTSIDGYNFECGCSQQHTIACLCLRGFMSRKCLRSQTWITRQTSNYTHVSVYIICKKVVVQVGAARALDPA